MSKIKMVVTDLDGTYFYNGMPMVENQRAVQMAREQGVKVFACTGRSWAMCSYTMQHIGMDEWAVTGNGASVTQVSTGKLHHPCFVDRQHVGPILRFIASNGKYKLNTYCGDMMYTTKELLPWWLEDSDKQNQTLPKEQWTRFTVCDSLEEMIEKSQDVCELIRLETGYERTPMPQEIQAYIDTLDEFQVTTSFDGHWDINHKQANKVRGVQYLAEKFGIAMDEVLAIGDDINDIQMIQAAGIGVAMGNAQASVKKATEYHTDLCKEHGFAKALEKWVLK